MSKPEIRLKGFEGEWNIKKLTDEVSLYGGLTYSPNDICENGVLVLRSSNVQQGEITLEDNVFVESSVVNSPNVEIGDIIVVVRNGSRSLIGKHAVIKNNMPNTVIGAFMTGLKSKNPEFINALLSTKAFDKEVNVNLGATINQITNGTLNSMSFCFPEDKEQLLIGRYYSKFDSMIQTTTKKITSLKQMKSASLISMFPQKGETKPRVRFKGFEGEWEDVSFKDITYLSGTKNRDNLPLESYSISNEKGFVPQNEQFEQGGTMSNADKRFYYIVTPDSFAYNPARINVGSIGYDDLDKDVIVSSLYVVFKTDENTNNYFLNHWFKTPMFREMIELYQEGGVRLYFFYDKLCQCHFRRPCLAEQEKIASFFTNLDKQISLQEQRLEKLKQIKAACLDKMFV